jgi:membrane protein implicated in regulation of membrane protease activity
MFAAVGIVGALVLVASLLFDDALEAVLPESDWLSLPALGAFGAAFGVVGWTAQQAFDASTGVAVASGAAAGLALGYGTVRLTRALLRSPTDATPRAADLVGAAGRVVTPLQGGRAGEVLVRLGGQPTKLTATAAADLATGTDVVVVAVESPTKVVVQSAAEFWT